MASPTRPYGVRFVPEMPKNSPMELGLSLAYVSSFDGIHTMIQLVCSLCAFVTAVSSRTHIYTLTELTVYVAPKPTPIFVIASMFCLFYVDLLIVAGATLSNFDAESLQSSLFYLMAATSGAIFSTCASVAFFVEAENSIDYALGDDCRKVTNCIPNRDLRVCSLTDNLLKRSLTARLVSTLNPATGPNGLCCVCGLVYAVRSILIIIKSCRNR